MFIAEALGYNKSSNKRKVYSYGSTFIKKNHREYE
jgi:hypothetical protein